MKPARLLLSAVLLVFWHLFMAWLARQLLPGNATRWALLPYIAVSLVYLAGVGWVARNLAADADEGPPNRLQALLAMLLAQILVQGFDWLTLSGPGDWSLTLLGMPLVSLGQIELILASLVPQNLGDLVDRALVVLLPLAVAFAAPENEQTEKRDGRGRASKKWPKP